MSFIKEHKRNILISLAVVIVILLYVYNSAEEQTNMTDISSETIENVNVEDTTTESKVESSTEPENVQVIVDIKGAVVHPGVYEASENERVIDVIQKAGGLLENADQTKINFAMRVKDEMVLYLPVVGEEAIPVAAVTASSSSGTTTTSESQVNLNTATDTELQTIPGIGPSKAAAIIEYRETNGNFSTIEELMEISGIGEKTFEKLKEQITVQ